MDSLKWWQKAVFYQIYPRSFADANGDGIGDIPGIISRLDYLQELGIDAIWLSPHFPSPLCDCGYDVSDYRGVAPEYGTLKDFELFLKEAHKRNLRLILDLVLNHTSDQHPWFIESRSSKNNHRRAWYIWRKGKEGLPPNNWYSTFGGPAWEYDSTTGEYYYHFFFKGQPDLNWRNPEVKQAMFDEARFWLDMGVDGFRLDAIGTIFEDPRLPNHFPEISQKELYRIARKARNIQDWQEYYQVVETMYAGQHDLPEVHDLMREFRQVINEYPERVLVGETDEIAFYGKKDDELHLNFNFPLMRTNRIIPAWVRANQKERMAALPAWAWPCNTLGNHDSPRVYNRYGDGIHNQEIARLNLALLLTLNGTPFLYNGEEIGMGDFLIDNLSLFRDPLSLNCYRMEIEWMGSDALSALHFAAENGRDKNRTPMAWANAANAGFCPPEITPWLPVNLDYAQGANVADQKKDPDSLLSFYRKMLHVRRENPALIWGDYQPLFEESNEYLAFLRTAPEQKCLVILNMSEAHYTVQPGPHLKLARLVFSSRAGVPGEMAEGKIQLAPFEIFIAEVD
ncbi:MAG: alpha-glucosidase [Anaerolineaceae bacterium]|jgi:alpha-glucosidase